MGDNDVNMDVTGQMQESQTSSDDKIDLSLDDIIKLNKKEQKANRTSNRGRSKRAAVLNKLNQIPQQQRGRRRGAQQYQGPGRMRGLRQRGSGRGMMSRGRGVNTMNRDAATTSGLFDQTAFTSRGTFRGRGRGGLSRGARGRASQRGGRPFLLDRGFSAARGAEKLEKYQKIRNRKTAPSGSTLTVSLPNAKPAPVALNRTNQTRRGGAALRGRSSGGASNISPKGIPLRFNYKASSNQTGLSLNERFTDLRVVGRGRGRGRGRGGIAGGGRGRGNIAQGGWDRGRGNMAQAGRGRGSMARDRWARGRGNIAQAGRGRGNITRGGQGRGRGRAGFTRGLTRQGRGEADRTVTLQ